MMASIPHTPALGFAPMPAVARVLAGFQRDQLANFIEVAIGLLDLADLADGDPEGNEGDTEDAFALSKQALGYDKGPGCNVSDSGGDQAWIEWTSLHPGTRKAGHNITAGEEDDEESDSDCGLDEGEPNFVAGIVCWEGGAGCPIADEGGCEHDGREPDTDAEAHPMLDDVPMLPVVTLDHNIFTDQRQPLGLSNLQSSFRVGREGVRSADSGAMLLSNGETWPRTPGVPV